MINDEYNLYLKERKKRKKIIYISRLLIIIIFLSLWQILSSFNIINSFLCSSPLNIIKTLFKTSDLLKHTLTTLYEIIICFSLGSLISIILAAILWWNKTLFKILEPYLSIINSIPKIALGPLIIIWAGAGQKSIVIMGLLISVISTLLSIYNSFVTTNKNSIKLLKSFGAKKYQIFIYCVLPYNFKLIVSSLKINLSMTFVGIIMGEFLVSKKGLGYLINYGSQVFNTNLIMLGIVILSILTSILYYIVVYIEIKIKNKST